MGVLKMDFSLSEEHKLLRQTISRFVKKNIIPLAEEIDAGEEIPSHLLQDIAKQGYFGIRYPEAYGGAGSDMISYIIMVEEMAYGSMSVAAAVSVHTSAGTMPIYRFGSEEQKQKYLVPAIKGEKLAVLLLLSLMRVPMWLLFKQRPGRLEMATCLMGVKLSLPMLLGLIMLLSLRKLILPKAEKESAFLLLTKKHRVFKYCGNYLR